MARLKPVVNAACISQPELTWRASTVFERVSGVAKHATCKIFLEVRFGHAQFSFLSLCVLLHTSRGLHAFFIGDRKDDLKGKELPLF